MSENDSYHQKLRDKMDEYVHYVYKITKRFPQNELYGVVSQLRRATLSIILNYIEGYARRGAKVHKNFLEISYGSLKESAYLLDFSFKEGYIDEKEFHELSDMANEIGAMLWGILKKME